MKLTKTPSITAELHIKRCANCGAILQSSNPGTTGFLSKENINAEAENLCSRCYELVHTSTICSTQKFDEGYKNILRTGIKDKALFVYIIDLLTFEGSMITNLQEIVSEALIVLNKSDLLPLGIDEDKIKAEALKHLQDEGIKAKGIILTSSTNNYNIESVIKTINELRNGKDVYFIGTLSTGKSSLLNAFLKVYKNMTPTPITTTNFVNTTVDVIKIPLDKKSYIYDTPGVYKEGSIRSLVESKLLKYIVPRQALKLRTILINEKQTLFLGALAAFNYIDGPKTHLEVYVSNDVDLNLVRSSKAFGILEDYLESHEVIPTSLTTTSLNDFESFEFTVPNGGSYSLIICGFGFIVIPGKGQKISVTVPLGIKVSLRLGSF